MVYNHCNLSPRFDSGIARSSGESLFPSLWEGLEFLFVPSLGRQGKSNVREYSYNHSGFTNAGNQSNPYVPNKYGYMFNFTGYDGITSVSNFKQLSSASQDLTVLFQIKQTVAQVGKAIITYRPSASPTPSNSFYARLVTTLVIGGFGDNTEYDTGISLQDGLIHTVAIRLNGTNLSVSIDGKKSWSQTVERIHADYGTSCYVRIGKYVTTGFEALTAHVGTVAIYRRAISDAELGIYLSQGNPLTPLMLPVGKYSGDSSVSADLNILTSSVEAPSYTASSNLNISTINLESSVQTPTIKIDCDIVPSTLVISGDVQDPTYEIRVETAILPDTLSISAGVQAPSVSTSVNINVDVLDLVSSIETPFIPIIFVEHLDTDIRWSELVTSFLDININSINAQLLNTDLRFNEIVTASLGIDIRFNSFALNTYVEPISRLKFVVFIDNVECSDVKMDAINIYHTEYDKSRATFEIARQHDNLDYTLDGGYQQVTNNNIVRIEIDGHIEFEGPIWNINANSELESVKITAYSLSPKEDERSLVTLSLPTVNERLNLFHAILNNPEINKPYIQLDEVNPSVYNGVFIEAGYNEIQNVARYESFLNVNNVVEYLTDGSFIPMQNWTYFWFASARNFISGKEWGNLEYIGTSPSALTGDTWDITGMAYKYQRLFTSDKIQMGNAIVFPINPTKINGVIETTETKYGYTLGTAPYKVVSGKSGALNTVDQWVDKVDGIYIHRDAHYNYYDYNQRILAIEYQKIQNINGDILPQTSVSIEQFIDAYYYYKISLLKRINIDNTIKSGIYNNLNGFPVSVKSIEINSGSMKVTLTCDNQWSKTELVEIEENMPEASSYEYPESNIKLYSKFDPRTQQKVQ